MPARLILFPRPASRTPAVAPPPEDLPAAGAAAIPRVAETLFQRRRIAAAATFKTVWGRFRGDLRRSAEPKQPYAAGTLDVKI
jgi:hypothetical protein